MVDDDLFERFEERLGTLEKRQLEDSTRMSEQIKTLFDSTKTLRNIIYVFCLLLLLTVIYGAVGGNGFNAVTHAATSNGYNHLVK
jgi:hypothetical protein